MKNNSGTATKRIITYTQEYEVAPCPFCGKEDQQFATPKYVPKYIVECGECGAQGGVGNSPDEAVGKWNQRA